MIPHPGLLSRLTHEKTCDTNAQVFLNTVAANDRMVAAFPIGIRKAVCYTELNRKTARFSISTLDTANARGDKDANSGFGCGR
jgi:hypothetical protein